MAASTVNAQLFVNLVKTIASARRGAGSPKGTAPQNQALLGGEVDVAVDGISFYILQIKQTCCGRGRSRGRERNRMLSRIRPRFGKPVFHRRSRRIHGSVCSRSGRRRRNRIIDRLNAEVVKPWR